jgi:hypothetical protein
MPTTVTSGRARFGSRKAASVASVSSCAIGGAAPPAAGADGSEKIHAAPAATRSAATPKALRKRTRLFMAIMLR